jgi:glycosyltransferase involved in cell wall biosynthesis
VSDPLRIVHFADTPRRGGAELVLVRNAVAQAQAGHHVEILTAQDWLAEEILAGGSGATASVVGTEAFRESDGLERRLRVVAQLFPLARALRRRRPDVLHVNNGGYPGSDLGRLIVMAARLVRVPLSVMTVHAVPRPRAGEPPGAAAIDRLTWSCVDRTIGATEAVRTALVDGRGMPAGKFRLVPYGVEDPGGDDADAAALRAGLGVAEDELLVGMLSAASDEQKGHHVLVRAIAQAPGVHAAIAGAAPPAEARADGAERVHVLGRVDDVGTFLKAVDVLSVPSVRDESLPLVVLEAMAAGRPVIASRLSGIPEAVEDGVTGRLVPPGDAAALAHALTAARSPDGRAELARLGTAGRARWEERFSVPAMTGATLAVYEG